MYTTAITAPSAARCMADLAWLLQSPPLLNLAPQRFSAAVQQFNPADAQRIAQWLASVDATALQAYVAQALPTKAPMRLGRYAERLMEYFLRESGVFELLAANVPLRSAAGADKTHTTVGEFDYLIKDASGAPWHWEMAVKFYLCQAAQTPAVAHDFKGPAGKDTLGLKLAKVFDRQLKHLPPAPFDATVWQAAAYARGWMFYPHGQAAVACDALNPQHLHGWWLGAAAFVGSQFESTHFVHLPRLHWLAPYAMDELPVMNQAQMAAYLNAFWLNADAKQADAAQMVACVTPHADGWRECSRGFVRPSLA